MRLVHRLGVSLRGLDARPERPDAVVLLCDGASASAGSARRNARQVVLGPRHGRHRHRPVRDDRRLVDLHSSWLRARPDRFDRPLPLHELRRSPWQVVVLRGVDACAFTIRDTIASALAAGAFTDAMGRRIPLGAALVVLTAPAVGTDGDAPAAALLAARLGPALIAACDVISGSSSGAAADARPSGSGASCSSPWRHALAGPATSPRSSRRSWPVSTSTCPPTRCRRNYLDQSITPSS